MTGKHQSDQRTTVEQLGSQSISERAAEWFLRWHASHLAPAELQEFRLWLKESPIHVAEFLRMVRLHAWLRKNRWVFGSVLDAERVNLEQAWKAIRHARDRDLVLWAEDSVPRGERIQQAVGLALPVPESTLKIMANHERERRSKRRERFWLIVGIVLSLILAPIVVANFPELIAAISFN